MEAQLKAPVALHVDPAAQPSVSPEDDGKFRDENFHPSNQAAWGSPPNYDFNDMSANFQFAMDGRDWPDTSNAIMTLPVNTPSMPESDKFPELHEVQVL